MFQARHTAIAASLALMFAFNPGAEAQTAPNRTNVNANVTTNQNVTQSPAIDNLTCRANPRAGVCRQAAEQRTAGTSQRQGSSATKGGGPRPNRR